MRIKILHYDRRRNAFFRRDSLSALASWGRSNQSVEAGMHGLGFGLQDGMHSEDVLDDGVVSDLQGVGTPCQWSRNRGRWTGTRTAAQKLCKPHFLYLSHVLVPYYKLPVCLES